MSNTNNSSIYLCGGCSKRDGSLNDLLAYKPPSTSASLRQDDGAPNGLWRTLPSLRRARDSAALVYCADAGNQLICVGGRTCVSLTDIPGDDFGHDIHQYSRAMSVVSEDVKESYLSTDFVVQQSMESFSISTQQWDDGGDMLTPKWRHGAVLLGNSLFVMGGKKHTRSLDDHIVYNLKNKQWGTVAPLSRPLDSMAAVAVENGKKLLIAGGSDDCECTHDEVSLYDPESNTWSAMPSMLHKRSGCAAATLNDGQVVYVVGGYVRGISTELVERIDLREGKAWSEVASMGERRRNAAVVSFSDGFLYVFGGGSELTSHTQAVERYNPSSNIWNVVDNIPNPGRSMVAVAVAPTV